MEPTTKSQSLATTIIVLIFSAIAGLATGATLSLPAPWSYATAGIALVTGTWSFVGAWTVLNYFTINYDIPKPRPSRIIDHNNSIEVDLIPDLDERLFIQKYTGASPSNLTKDDITHCLYWIYTNQTHSRAPMRRKCKLPRTGRPISRIQYDQLLEILTAARIIQDRGPGHSGRLAVPLLSQALRLHGLDPESVNPGRTGPGQARPGSIPRSFIIRRIKR